VLTEAGTGGKEARHEASVHDCVPLRQNLGEEDLRHLTKKFAELGTAPGVLAHYERLDGMGEFMIEDVSQDDTKRSDELTLRYSHSLIGQPVRVCLRTRYRPRSTGWGSGFNGAAEASDRCGRC
jgi:hypothetical protein